MNRLKPPASGPRVEMLEARDTPASALSGYLPLVVGAGVGGGPDVQVYDPKSGALITEFLAYDAAFGGGVLAAVGDVTGDRIPDIVTAPMSGGGADIRVWNGATGELVTAFLAYGAEFQNGASVAVGDVDGDGIDDIITGAGAGGGSHVRVFQGGTFAPIRDFLAYGDVGFYGGVTVAAADFDGDGHADVVTGTGSGGADVRVFSGLDGTLTRSFLAFESPYSGGVTVATGDVDGDGDIDIIAGQGGQGSSVFVFDVSGEDPELVTSVDPYDSFTGGTRVSTLLADPELRTVKVVTGAGPGGGPAVRFFQAATADDGTVTLTATKDFLAFGPTFSGGANVG